MRLAVRQETHMHPQNQLEQQQVLMKHQQLLLAVEVAVVGVVVQLPEM